MGWRLIFGLRGMLALALREALFGAGVGVRLGAVAYSVRMTLATAIAWFGLISCIIAAARTSPDFELATLVKLSVFRNWKRAQRETLYRARPPISAW